MRPEEPYEMMGDVPDVVFPCGVVVDPDGDTLRIYYGGADTVVALATASISELLDWLRDQQRQSPSATRAGELHPPELPPH
jgi:predicted GH43/DUF377 family glycosyl hydrolase